jgi:hypothetical protein
MGQHIADVEVVDGVWRAVYQDSQGREYVIDASGEPVYGVWFIPPDDPQPCVTWRSHPGSRLRPPGASQHSRPAGSVRRKLEHML